MTSPAGLVSTMNKCFINKIKNLRNAIPVVLSDPLAKMKEAMKWRKCWFQLQPVSETEGVDYIDTRSFKLVEELINSP